MYKNFFGLKERPFKLVPNPAYLFLSRSHEETLAHLSYAISQGDGFVEITGEVGTGKTTLCRAFLESLSNNTEAAYIFNPRLNSIELLKAINDEFGISSDPDNIKDLIDILNFFLMAKKAEGAKVILLIDEAQNLTKEVLEQLRLLSNLETSVDKLLQIILVGQPELGEMLDSPELRQLGQRITISCHLSPLTYNEMKGYIRHRVNIASQGPGIKFTWGAYRSIFKYSGGIPRLVNIACDRALLTAYGFDRLKITRGITKASIRELAARGDIKRYIIQKEKKTIIAFSLLAVALFIVILYQPGILNIGSFLNTSQGDESQVLQPEQPEEKIETTPSHHELIKSEGQKNIEIEPVSKTVADFEYFLKNTDMGTSRRTALEYAMELWNTDSSIKPYLDSINDDQTFFRLSAKQSGLLIYSIKGDLGLVKRLNLPAILELYIPGGLSPCYLTVVKMDDSTITFTGEESIVEVVQDEIAPFWSGVAYIPWKDFYAYGGDIRQNSSEDSIITLKSHLRDIGFNEVEISPFYDNRTRDAVQHIQEKHGIPVDGIVGPMTKIVLYNETESLKVPRIGNAY